MPDPIASCPKPVLLRLWEDVRAGLTPEQAERRIPRYRRDHAMARALATRDRAEAALRKLYDQLAEEVEAKRAAIEEASQ